MTRHTLPSRRQSELIDVAHAGHVYTIGCSRFPDGLIAEIFVDAAKSSSALADAARDLAIVTSLALRFGCPIDTIRHALTRSHDNSAAGPLGRFLDLLEDGQ